MAFKGKDVAPEKKTDFTYQGKEIILSKTRGRPLLNKHWKKGFHTDAKRIEAATIYAATGSVERVETLTGVSQATVKGWIREPWFRALLDDIRAENDHVIDAKFNQILDKTLEMVVDRLDNGDFHVMRDGTLVRKPVGLKDLTISQAITIDKRQLLRGKPTSRSENVNQQAQVEEKLAILAESFKKLAGHSPRKVETIEEVEVIQEIPYNHAEEIGDAIKEGSDQEGTEGQA